MHKIRPNQTITNSLGQKTLYRYAIIGGEHRLYEVRGAGCSSCGPANVRYRYDGLGRLLETTQLNAQGVAINGSKTELDALGRIVQVSRISYDKSSGKPGQPQWQVRYAYAGNNQQPGVMARPSVVAGKEVQTRLVFNDNGQVVSMTESGFSPSSANEKEVTALDRSTTYRYATINGRSLLIEIDGPLPNGKTNNPVDSDITRIEWDSRGNAVAAMIAPGNFKSTFRYDLVGRIADVTNQEGQQTSFAYNTRNQTIATTTDGITQSTQYDWLGRPVEAGTGEGKSYQALVRMGFDEAGQNRWTASHLGLFEQLRFDTEGNLLESLTQSGGIRQTQSYSYDAVGRLVSLIDGNGTIRRIGWNEQNLPSVMTDALGREKLYRYDAVGNLAQVIAAANTAQARIQNTAMRFEHDLQGRTKTVIAPNGVSTRYVRDDFGHTTAIISPDSGAVTRTYDAAGKITASTDASGNHASYAYDVTGRIIRQTVTQAQTHAAAPAKQTTATTWEYAGKRLAAVKHPNQTERYRYDGKGRLDSKTVTVTLASGKQISSSTRYGYDALGQPAFISLPDGSHLIYQRNGQQQLTAIERSRIQTPWLRWLLPAVPVAKEIERDMVGLTYFTYGNGVEAHYLRSREGVLARIVYRHPNAKPDNIAPGKVLDALLGVSPAHAAAAAPSGNQTIPASVKTPELPGALGLAADQNALIDHRYLWDAQGNMLLAQSKDATRSFAYDAQDRLIAASRQTQIQTQTQPGAGGSHDRYFYDAVGNRLLAQEGVIDPSDTQTRTVKTSYSANTNRWQGESNADGVRYDASGQPERIGQREYVWDAMGKLLAVRQEGGKPHRTIAAYRYNHKGERISKRVGNAETAYLYEGRKLVAELDEKGHVTRQYLYLADQPVAVIDTPQGSEMNATEGSALAQIGSDIATAWQGWFGNAETVSYLHNNHLGATELVTDGRALPVWKAAYRAFGQIDQASFGKSKFVLNLRLPGQYEDAETGLYYNDHRYYDPQRGQYLTPDPLGLRGEINSYAYVNGNPLKYIDPSGLILFAFDGTGNSENPPDGDSISNVQKFFQAYDVPTNGERFYITGIGTTNKDMTYKGSIITGDGIDQRLKLGFTFLDDFLQTNEGTGVLDIDVVGFSRGAATARVWINQLVSKLKNGAYTANGKTRCINFRFEGLWDTVPHLGAFNGEEAKYDFSIPAAVKHAAHANAVNEYRGGWIISISAPFCPAMIRLALVRPVLAPGSKRASSARIPTSAAATALVTCRMWR